MKASSFFGGTRPKDQATKVRQVGHSGSVQSKTGQIPRVNAVKQAKGSPVPSSFTRQTRVKQVGEC